MNTIYIDVLFGVNMFVNYFILLACAKITRSRVKFLRMLWGSLLATLFTGVIFLPEVHFILSLLMRLVISGAVTLATFGYGGLPKYLSRLFSFYSVSFGYAGIVLAIWFLFEPPGIMVNNGAVYIHLSPYVLLSSFCVGYFLLLLLRRHFGTEIKRGDIFNMKINFLGKSTEVSVLYDTGNRLKDLFSDLPVAVVNFEEIREILPLEMEPCFAGGQKNKPPERDEHKERYRIIPYSVIGGGGVLPAIKIDRAEVWKNHKKIWENRCIIAVSREYFEEGVGGIIGEDFIK